MGKKKVASKKTGRLGRNSSKGANTNARSGPDQGFRSHDAFESALRRYAHPAAAADLDALPRGGPAWRRFLEAFGTTCRDNVALHMQRTSLEGRFDSNGDVDAGCPLVRALVDMSGPQILNVLTNNIWEGMKQSLQSCGRPLPSKRQMLMEHEARVAHMYRESDKAGDPAMGILRNTSNSVRKTVDLHTTKMDWSKLTKISIRDLKLYDNHEGKFLEGILLVEPFTPMVGTTTILEDSNGDVVLIALYNFLPDGLYGRESIPVASAKIPKGCKIRIAEPFQKLFRDGSRGIRIDDPKDISVVSGGVAGAEDEDEDVLLAHAKASGNGLVGKKMYVAAAEAYIEGIRAAETVPTLLSNRSQAYAMVGDWGRSLADAAASLTLRPGSKKTWARYRRALGQMSDGTDKAGDVAIGAEGARRILRRIASLHCDDEGVGGPDARVEGPAGLKAAGNAAFKGDQYGRAATLYTSALAACGETSRALLSNWALCCLHSGANLDAVAAAAASLRIRPEAKAVMRFARGLLTLGEPSLCLDILQSGAVEIVEGSDMFGEKNDLLQSAACVVEHLQNEGKPSLLSVLTAKYLPKFVGDIDTYNAGPKGRGVRARADLKAGQIVLIEPPFALAATTGLEGKRRDALFSLDKADLKDPSQAYLRQAILLRSQREAVLSRIVDCLSDGINARPVTPLDDLIPNIASCQLLLPSHSEYMHGEKVELSSDRVDAIVSVNSHGTGGGKEAVDRFTKSTSTCLLPATSMFNHAACPTCKMSDAGGCTIIFAIADAKAGEELSLCYHPNEEIVRSNWGITS